MSVLQYVFVGLAAVVIAETSFVAGGQQLPFAFELPYDPRPSTPPTPMRCKRGSRSMASCALSI